MLHILGTATHGNEWRYNTPTHCQIKTARTSFDFCQARELLKTYAASFAVDLFTYDDLAQELCTLPSAYRAPGFLLLAKDHQQAVGCVGLRARAKGVGEMKRLFVLPEQTGRRVGRDLLRTLIGQAVQQGFRTLQLEVLSSSKPAVHLYRQFGFRETAPFRDVDVDDLLTMELALASAPIAV